LIEVLTKTERQRDRTTERQKDRKTERQKDRKTERQKDRKTERQKDKHKNALPSTIRTGILHPQSVDRETERWRRQ
jgi:hypothetical protein